MISGAERAGEKPIKRFLGKLVDRLEVLIEEACDYLRTKNTAVRISNRFFKGSIGLPEAYAEINELEKQGLCRPGVLQSRFDEVMHKRAAIVCPKGPSIER